MGHRKAAKLAGPPPKLGIKFRARRSHGMDTAAGAAGMRDTHQLSPVVTVHHLASEVLHSPARARRLPHRTTHSSSRQMSVSDRHLLRGAGSRSLSPVLLRGKDLGICVQAVPDLDIRRIRPERDGGLQYLFVRGPLHKQGLARRKAMEREVHELVA